MEHLHNAYDYTLMARNHVVMYVSTMHEKHKTLYDEFKDDPDAESKLRGHISYIDDVYDDLDIEHVYVVWFCYILGGWKALCSTCVEDGKYYEVTYDDKLDRTYVDEYAKRNQLVFEERYVYDEEE